MSYKNEVWDKKTLHFLTRENRLQDFGCGESAEYSEKNSLGINACCAGGYEELLIRLA